MRNYHVAFMMVAESLFANPHVDVIAAGTNSFLTLLEIGQYHTPVQFATFVTNPIVGGLFCRRALFTIAAIRMSAARASAAADGNR